MGIYLINHNKMGDFVQEVTEMFWSETTLEMGFIKFFITFVIIFVIFKAYVYLIEGNDQKRKD